MLTNIPTKEEVEVVVFVMDGDGAPRPDGFGGSFYQAFCDIIGFDVDGSVFAVFLVGLVSARYEFKPSYSNTKSLVHTKLSENFRPISLANFQFKIITKVFANRLTNIALKLFLHSREAL